MSMWMQALLQAATLWASFGQTPATTALGLKTTVGNASKGRVTIAKWIILSVLMPALYRQLRQWYDDSSSRPSSSDQDDDDPIARIAHERQRMLVRVILETVDRTIPLLRLFTLISWWSGRSTAPQLAMTLAGVSLVATRPPHRIHVNFAHRRWLYEELVRCMQILAPFSSWEELSSLYSGLLRPFKDSWERIRRSSRSDSEASRCPLCRSDPMTIPFVTNCGHVYCYSCLWNATSNNNLRFACPICGQAVRSSQRYQDKEET